MSWNFASLYVPDQRPDSGFRYRHLQNTDPDQVPDQMARLSREHGEAIHLWIDAHSEMFAYAHWVQGEQRRFLARYDEGWGPLEGEPETWEQSLFDRPAELAEAQEWEPENAEAFQAIWEGRAFVAGSNFPYCSAEDIASVVARDLKLQLFPER